MAQNGRTRISDIASRLGVSTATVSRALSGKSYVRDGLASQIRAAAVEMNYALPGGVTGQRVLLVSSQEAMIDFQRSQFTMHVLAGVQERADAQDIRVEAFTYRNSADLLALHEAAAAPDVIGVLLVTVDDAVLRAACDLPCPAVIVNGDDPQMQLSSVTPCNRSAAALATRHLMGLGHRRIAFLNRPGRRTILRRFEGWRDALADAFDPALAIEVDDWTAEAAQRSVTGALQGRLDFTAIVAAGDILAAGAIAALQCCGRHVPGDVSVLGIDGLPQGQYLSPALSTISIPMHAVGALSLELLCETLRLRRAGVPLPARRIELACELIQRASCGTACDPAPLHQAEQPGQAG
ncbi:LacI family DNA-binding transcriptional regulator [Paracoccus sp. (in: a-proteobacteria)]|uniref:LacI family DNA-binding transcriptional regulator n=1 Tax=Paracoccus sp. TaxID=267 RepID=UPI003A84EA3E